MFSDTKIFSTCCLLVDRSGEAPHENPAMQRITVVYHPAVCQHLTMLVSTSLLVHGQQELWSTLDPSWTNLHTNKMAYCVKTHTIKRVTQQQQDAPLTRRTVVARKLSEGQNVPFASAHIYGREIFDVGHFYGVLRAVQKSDC